MKIVRNTIQHLKHPFSKDSIHLGKDEKIAAIAIGCLLSPFLILPGIFAFYGVSGYFKYRKVKRQKSSNESTLIPQFDLTSFIRKAWETNTPIDFRIVKNELERRKKDVPLYLSLFAIRHPSLYSKLITQALKFPDKKALTNLLNFVPPFDITSACEDLKDADHVELKVGSKKFYLSKNFLSFFMPHVLEWFTKFQETNKIDLPDVDPILFKRMFSLILTRNSKVLKLNASNISHYLYLAGLLQIPLLNNACKRWLEENLDNYDLNSLAEIFQNSNFVPVAAISKRIHAIINKGYAAQSEEDKEFIKAMLPFIRHLKFEQSIDSEFLNLLSQYDNIESLKIFIDKPEDVETLHSFHNLKSIYLKLGDGLSESLDDLSGLPVKALLTWTNEINDLDLEAICNCSSIECLQFFADSPISRDGYARLVNLSKLRELGIVGSVDFSLFPDLSSVNHLFLCWSSISDNDLDYLSRFPKLKSINISKTSITDTGLLTLAKFPQLKSITLSDDVITQAGRTALAAALPNCKIIVA